MFSCQVVIECKVLRNISIAQTRRSCYPIRILMEDLENKELENFVKGDDADGGEPFVISSRKSELLGSLKRRSEEFYK